MEKKRAKFKFSIVVFIHKILPISIPLILIVVFFFRLFFPQPSIFMIPDFGESDVLNYNLPLKNFLNQSLKDNTWPLWTNNIANGFPLLAEGQIGTFYLPNMILFKFLPFIYAYNLSYVFSYIFLAIGTYYLFRMFKFSPLTSSLASIIFTFSGFFSVHLNHLNLLQTVSLTPLLWASCFRVWRRPSIRNMCFLSLLTAEQFFAGYVTIFFISLFVVILFLILFEFLIYKGFRDKYLFRRILILSTSFVFAILLSAIQLLPTLELVKLSTHSSGLNFENATAFPYPPKHLLTFFKPYLFGSPGLGTYPGFSDDWGIFWENTAYLGLLPLILAFFSLFYLKKRRVLLFVILLLVSLLFITGKYSPLYLIFTFPPFNFFRVPSRYLILTIFSLTYLSAVTLDKIFNYFKSRKKVLFVYVLYLLFFTIIVADEFIFSYRYPPVSKASFWLEAPKSLDFIKGNKNAKIVTLGSSVKWNDIFLHKGWIDIEPYVFFTNYLYPNYNLIFDIAQFNSTTGLFPRRITIYTDIAKNIILNPDKKTASVSSNIKNALKLSGVKYLISAFPIKDQDLKLVASIDAPVNIPTSPVLIYDLNNQLGNFYLSTKTQDVNTLQDFFNYLNKYESDDSNKIAIEDRELSLNNILDNTKTQAKLDYLVVNNQTAKARVSVNKPTILVWNNNNYPGWTAYDNNAKIPIYNVNLTFIGVPLKKGQHDLAFVFQSRSFELGKKITVFSGLIIFLILLLDLVSTFQKGSGNTRLSPYSYSKSSN